MSIRTNNFFFFSRHIHKSVLEPLLPFSYNHLNVRAFHASLTRDNSSQLIVIDSAR